MLWSKDYWANKAKKSQVDAQLSKQRISNNNSESALLDAKFLNTVAQVYGKLFGLPTESCSVKEFDKCPHMGQRQDLLTKGSLASVFVTILHKGTMAAMLDRHPLDSGLLGEEYDNVYGIDLTDFQDLEVSLTDGRFEALYRTVLKHAKQLAGIP